jgi:hypothetical protein
MKITRVFFLLFMIAVMTAVSYAADLKSEFLCELKAELEAPQLIGTTPAGGRRVVYVKSGTFAGPRLKGQVLPGGGDWTLERSDGIVQLDVRITLRTEDGALIYATYRGVLDAKPEVLQRLRRGEVVDPAEYYFRTTPVFETSAEQYQWLNRIVAVGVGRRTPSGVEYSIYAIK